MWRVIGLLLIPVVFYSCKNNVVQSNLCLISENFWTFERRHSATDSALYIGLYKETDNYLNYWTNLEHIPFRVSSVLKNEIEFVDDRTIYWNKGNRFSNDYKLLLKKGLIVFSDNNDIDDSLDGMMYAIRKRDGVLKSTSLVNFFQALENNKTARWAQTKLEEDKGFDEVSESLFNQHQ